MCNFLGSCSVKSAKFDVVSTPVVSVSFLGQHFVTVQRSAPLSLSVGGSISSCGVVTRARPTYSWSLEDITAGTVTSITSASKDPSRLTISSFSLESLKSYSVTVLASAVVGSAEISSYASVQVYVAQATLVAIIAGGQFQTLTQGKALIVDGSGSYDPDLATARSSGLRFLWSCTEIEPTFSAASCGLELNTSSVKSSALQVNCWLQDVHGCRFAHNLGS
jgi:hypothetical protein